MSMMEDKKHEGVIYDGFTYFIPEIQSFTKEESSKDIEQLVITSSSKN
jgi:hypothetical protein